MTRQFASYKFPDEKVSGAGALARDQWPGNAAREHMHGRGGDRPVTGNVVKSPTSRGETAIVGCAMRPGLAGSTSACPAPEKYRPTSGQFARCNFTLGAA